MKNTKEKILKTKGILPLFPGFYETGFDNEEKGLEEMAKKCVECVEEWVNNDLSTNINMYFIDIYNPISYNYSNDSINIDILMSIDDFEKIKKYIKEKKDNFKAYLDNNFKSRPGFVSYYSDKYEVWINSYLKEEYEDLGLIVSWALEFILKDLGYTVNDLYECVF
jgi:hypothetical protein